MKLSHHLRLPGTSLMTDGFILTRTLLSRLTGGELNKRGREIKNENEVDVNFSLFGLFGGEWNLICHGTYERLVKWGVGEKGVGSEIENRTSRHVQVRNWKITFPVILLFLQTEPHLHHHFRDSWAVQNGLDFRPSKKLRVRGFFVISPCRYRDSPSGALRRRSLFLAKTLFAFRMASKTRRLDFIGWNVYRCLYRPVWDVEYNRDMELTS